MIRAIKCDFHKTLLSSGFTEAIIVTFLTATAATRTSPIRTAKSR